MAMHICWPLRVGLLLHFVAFVVADMSEVSSFAASVPSHDAQINALTEPDLHVCQESLEGVFDKDAQESKVDDIWEAVGNCARHLSQQLGPDVRKEMKESEAGNKKYLHEIADVYAVLKYLQGPTMLAAFRDEHNSFVEEQKNQMDEIDDALAAMEPYREYNVHDFIADRETQQAKAEAEAEAREEVEAVKKGKREAVEEQTRAEAQQVTAEKAEQVNRLIEKAKAEATATAQANIESAMAKAEHKVEANGILQKVLNVEPDAPEEKITAAANALRLTPEKAAAVLGVAPGAKKEVLRKAYRAKILKWHPDKNLDIKFQADALFKIFTQAYEALYRQDAQAEADAKARQEAERMEEEARAKFGQVGGQM